VIPATQIDVIFFDMGYTLRTTKKHTDPKQRSGGLKKIIKLLDLDISPEELDQMLVRGAEEYKKWALKTLMEASEEELWTKWMLPNLPAKRIRKNAIKLQKYWRQVSGTRIVMPETRHVLEELFRRGYRLGLISNTTSSREAPMTLKELGLDKYVEVMVLSTVFGKRKPHPSIFLHATKSMLVEPERCAYVGDRPDRDVEGSRNAGFAKSILIRDPRNPYPKTIGPHQVPDHKIKNLKELLKIFPPRYPSITRRRFFILPVRGSNGSAKWNASLSSMWMMGRFHDLNECLAEIKRIGFKSVELNHQVDSRALSKVDLHKCNFSGIHEPCPADIPAIMLKEKDLLISSLDEGRRQLGVRMTKRSINLAHDLGARVVIVHAGMIPGDDELEQRLRKLFRSGKRSSSEYEKLLKQARKIKSRHVSEHLDAVKVSLQELIDYAKPYSVKLGIENRYHFMDIPGPDELAELLKVASEDQIGFIFDVGHAVAMDRMGFYPFHEWLTRFSERIIGVHIHDVKGIEDHQPPGLGDVDFSSLAAYIPPDAFRTLEVKANSTSEQIIAGLQLLEQKGCITQL
jgi:HAD superfamily hydrolase (TIGR01549 family)